VTTRLSSAPRWVFARLAVVVTLVLWVPDLWILVHGQPPRAVAVLVVMHLAIALCTYNLLVHLAPVRPPSGTTDRAPQAGAAPRDTGPGGLSPHRARQAGVAMGGLVGLELGLGIAALVLVPYDRSLTWLPARGQAVYLAHAVVGGILGIGAVTLLLGARTAPRIARLGSVVGVAGVMTAAVGGVASVDHPTRLLGVGLMLVGTMVAGFGYLMMVIEVTPREPGPGPPGSPLGDQDPGPVAMGSDA
jgi:hypothetical protein